MTRPPPSIAKMIADRYEHLVRTKHASTAGWPVIAGHNFKTASYGNALVVILTDTGHKGATMSGSWGELSRGQVGAERITAANRASVIERLESVFAVGPRDMIIVAEDCLLDGRISISHDVMAPQLDAAMAKHEMVQGLMPMKIFLSHKGADKPKVREFKETLALLGFDPWLDEDAMPAGTSLERGILNGMKESCAAVFFVTSSFVDESYLGAEVEYALGEKRARKEFSVVTLVFKGSEGKGSVPALLRPYVWKEPENDLVALREILKALPLKVGPVRSRM